MIDQASGAFGGLHCLHFPHNIAESRGIGFDSGRQRIAAKRPEPHRACRGPFARLERKAFIVNHDEAAAALNDRAWRREIEGYDRDLLMFDVAPDIELGPIRQWKNPN